MAKVIELKSQLSKHIFDILNGDSFKKKFKELIAQEFKNTLISKKEELLQGETVRIFRNSIKINLHKFFKSSVFKEELYSFIDNNIKGLESSDRTVGSIVSPAVVNGLKVYIYNNKDEMLNGFKKYLSSENINKKMEEEINRVLSGLNPLASRFISAETIITRLKSGIEDFLDDKKNMMDIVNMINTQLDGMMKKKLSELASSFPAESKSSIANSISTVILDNLSSEKFIDMIIFKLEDLLNTALTPTDENSVNKLISFDNIIKSFVDSLYDNTINSNNAKELINIFSTQLSDWLLNKPLKS